ncbi:hypothetical protein Tco_0828979 [Tanacetum coccineum]
MATKPRHATRQKRYQHDLKPKPWSIVWRGVKVTPRAFAKPLRCHDAPFRTMLKITYVNLTSSSKEQPNERTPLPPLRKKSLSPPQAPSKSISSKSTHYTSSSSLSESPTTTYVAPPPKLCFVIPIKQEPHELPPLQMLPNNPHVSTKDNWPSDPSNPSPPTRV